jgi:hypothetical protein
VKIITHDPESFPGLVCTAPITQPAEPFKLQKKLIHILYIFRQFFKSNRDYELVNNLFSDGAVKALIIDGSINNG